MHVWLLESTLRGLALLVARFVKSCLWATRSPEKVSSSFRSVEIARRMTSLGFEVPLPRQAIGEKAPRLRAGTMYQQ